MARAYSTVIQRTERRTYLAPNTVKSYTRTIYRELALTSRVHAVLWGIEYGFSPDHHHLDHWRGGP